MKDHINWLQSIIEVVEDYVSLYQGEPNDKRFKADYNANRKLLAVLRRLTRSDILYMPINDIIKITDAIAVYNIYNKASRNTKNLLNHITGIISDSMSKIPEVYTKRGKEKDNLIGYMISTDIPASKHVHNKIFPKNDLQQVVDDLYGTTSNSQQTLFERIQSGRFKVLKVVESKIKTVFKVSIEIAEE